MKTKKILAIFTAWILALSLFLPTVSAIATEWTGSDNIVSSPKKKVQKLKKLWDKLKVFIINDLKKDLAKINSVDDKKIFTDATQNLKDNLDELIKKIEYGYDYNFQNYLVQLKAVAQNYKTIKNEIANFILIWANPYKIDASVNSSIETDLIWIQKDVVIELKKYLEIYIKSGFKKAWKQNFEISTELWKLTVNLEKYTSIFAFLTRSQEVDFVINVWIDGKIPKTAQTNTDTYFNWDFKIDTNIKIIGTDLYINLKDYTINFSSSDKDVIKQANFTLTQIKWQLDAFKWKIVHLKLPEQTVKQTFNQTEILANIDKILDILETNSLFTPYKRIDSGYILTVNGDALKKITTTFNQPIKDGEIKKIEKNMYKNPIIYAKTWNEIELFTNIKESSASWILKLIKWEDSTYTFKWNIIWLWTDTWNNLNFLIKNKYVDYVFETKEVTMKIKLENDNFDFLVKWMNKTFNINWVLSEWKTDLKINLDSKNIWYIKVNKIDTKYDYDLMFNIEIPSNIGTYISTPIKTITVKIVWDYDIQFWDFTVEKPSSFIEIEDINPDYKIENEPVDFSELQ